MNPKALALIAVIVVAVIASGAYLSGTFGGSKTSSSGQTVDMQVIGGVGVGTVDTYVPANFTVTEGRTSRW